MKERSFNCSVSRMPVDQSADFQPTMKTDFELKK